jgi:hypothetical protein
MMCSYLVFTQLQRGNHRGFEREVDGGVETRQRERDIFKAYITTLYCKLSIATYILNFFIIILMFNYHFQKV